MSGKHRYQARVTWHRLSQEPFVDNRYSRAHQWSFDGGVTVPASSSPSVVPLPLSEAAAVDPEEAFVAALSSCHMLFFLSYAAQQGWVVEEYTDDAEGRMGANEDGCVAMLDVVLRPRIRWGIAPAPDAEEVAALHERSHRSCFIANSVRTAVRVESP